MSTGQFHFFTGENDYALERELTRWKQGFFQKHGAENFLEIHAKDATPAALLDAVSVMPFIAEKRLVLLKGLPRIERDEMKTVAAAIHPKTVFVVADAKPDKRLGVTKEVLSLAEVKEFASLSPKDLAGWAAALVAAEGASIGTQAFARLLSVCGDNQWVLDSELRKLAAFAGGEITAAHIDELAVPSGEQVVWRLTDLVGGCKADEALCFLGSRIERGEDPYGLWVILLNMIKNTALVWSALEADVRDERSIASAFGMHFLSVRGLLPLARSLDRGRMQSLVNFASEADLALKTGGYHYTSEHQEEVVALAERAILFCR